ncbi:MULTISPECIES: hypothetical protein [Flavobacteriaceae]|uniref:hypothetical protein n=1 Tax=Flavobacteriaceae TaxID=49546 RepID=UPI001D17FE14|nr:MULTISPECIES: hypothetical protein [Flavobacteriaceae]MCC4227848.1 hypothetical protein [Zunongwangia profunda]
MTIAQYFLNLSAINENAEILSAHLKRLSFEQLCLGTIYAFLNYHPQHHHSFYLPMFFQNNYLNSLH